MLEDEGALHGLGDALRDEQVVSRARERLGGAAVVSRDGPELFIYAGSQQDAEHAEQVLRDVLGDRAANAQFERTRWHDAAASWEPWSVALPGLMKRTPWMTSKKGWCVWPKTTQSTFSPKISSGFLQYVVHC